MTAVVRVKRYLNEEPLDTLIFNHKKRKVDDQQVEDEQTTTIFKFAATTDNNEEDVFNHVKSCSKVQAEDQYKKHAVDVTEKLRNEANLSSKNNRYKVVNCQRSIVEPEAQSSADGDTKPSYTILDLEMEKNEKESQKEDANKAKYVFDLYYTDSEGFVPEDFNELISVYPLSDELVYDTYRDNSMMCHSEDSDSNDENNWRNDYPDESDHNSITEEDMVKAMQNMNCEEENQLSSDEGEEQFVYSVDNEGIGFEEGLDDDDVRRYGKMYAKFKAKHQNDDSDPEFYDCDDGDDNECYYD